MKIVDVAHFFTSGIEKIGKAFKSWKRRNYERKVNRIIDNSDDDGLIDLLHRIQEKRNKRRDSS